VKEGNVEPITPEPADIPVIGIVDDDEDVRIALEALVASIGFRSKLFETADALVESGRLADLDCIVTDLQMPGMNGLSLARHIQATSPRPVILITAFPAPGLDGQAASAGVRRLLRKPFDPLTLIDELEMILGDAASA
jgi:FixJ family two-component response regulator